jgi:calmodulin
MPGGYKPSFGDGTPRRRNLTFDPQRKPVSVSADTLSEIEQIRATYRAQTEASGPSGSGGAKVSIERATGRDPLSFTRHYKDVNMDMTKEGIRALSTKDRLKQQTSVLRQVFRTMDADKDGQIDEVDLETQLIRLGYVPEPGEVHDMIWEVDDDGDGKINWREFKAIYQRVRDDELGKEPRRLYNVMEFMVFDTDNDGSIDLAEVMQLFYLRYGKDKLFSETKDAPGTERRAKDITFPEFVKHDESFYTLSRQIADQRREREAAAAGAEGDEEEPTSPTAVPRPPLSSRRRQTKPLRVRLQNPGRLRSRRHRTMGQNAPETEEETDTESVWEDDTASVVQPDPRRGRGKYEEAVPDEEYRGVLDPFADKSPYMQAVEALKVADRAAAEAAMNDFPARWAAVKLYEEGSRLIDVACNQKTEEGETVLNFKLLGALQGRKDSVNKQIKKLTPPITKGMPAKDTGHMPATQRRVRRPSKIIYVHYGLQSAS